MPRLTKILAILLVVVIIGIIGIFAGLLSLNTDVYKQQLSSLVSNSLGRSLTIEGALTPVFSLTPSLKATNLTLANASWYDKNPLLKAEEVSFQVKLLPLFSGKLEVDAVTLNHASIVLAVDEKGQESWDFSKAAEAQNKQQKKHEETKATDNSAPSISISTITLKDVTIRYHDLAQKTVHDIAITHASLNKEQDNNILTVNSLINYNTLPISIKGTIDTPQDNGNGHQVALNIASKGNTLILEGNILESADKLCTLAATIKSPELPALLNALNIKVVAPKSLTGSMHTTCYKNRTELQKMAFSVPGSQIKGTMTIDTNAPRPALKGKIQATSLPHFLTQENTSSSIATEDSDSGNTAKQTPPRAIPDITLPEKLPINADITLQIDTLAFNKINADDVNIDVSSKNQSLSAIIKSAKVAEGNLTGDIKYIYSPAALSAHISAKNLKTEALAAMAGLSEDIKEGKTYIELDIKGDGNNLRKILAGSQGKATLYTENAVYQKEVNLGGATDFLRLLQGKTGKKLKIKCAIGDFGISNGSMYSKALVFDTTGATITGSGYADLEDEKLSFVFTPSAKDIGLGNLAVPMRLYGSFFKPSFGPDPKGLAMTAGKTALGIASGVGILGAIALKVVDNLQLPTDKNPCLEALENGNKKEAEKTAPSPSPAPQPSETAIGNDSPTSQPIDPAKALEKKLQNELKKILPRF